MSASQPVADLTPRPQRSSALSLSADQLSALVAAQRAIACAPAEAQTIFELTADLACSLVDAEGAVVGLADGDKIVVRATAGRAAVRRRSQRAGRTVPLVHEAAVMGLITITPRSARALDDSDLALLTSLAEVAAHRLAEALHREERDALWESAERFRVAFDNAPIGMSMLDLTPGNAGRYLRANDVFCQMLGYTHDELATLSMPDLTHPDDIEGDSARFATLLAGETEEVCFDKRYRRKDGDTAYAWLHSAVVSDSHGEPLYLVTHAVDVGHQRQQQAELERLALTDTLTGLANRTLLSDRLDQAIARLQRGSHAVALLLLDIDRFKLVNDTLGHQTGDALLIEVANRIEAISRAESTVARVGGDEFVVLVEDMRDPDEACIVAQRLIEVLRRPYALSVGSESEALVATVSIGISVATTADRSPGELYREADLALYRAKDSGRDQFALFDDDLRARAVARLESETMLRRALTEDRLVVHFQPVVDASDGRVRAVEALVRLDDARRGLVAPAGFIDVAEETGMIVDLDARVFEKSLAQFSRWLAKPGSTVERLSVNVSARSLEDPTFVDRMQRAMTWYDVRGSSLHVELTERSLLSPSPPVHESLRRLSELGIHVGLDDFGTGYSALAYLQRFSLQFLKIDRAFVSRLGDSDRDDAVVAAVIGLAHAHDLMVVAEGVETEEQLAALRLMGCDRAQGFLLGRPMPPSDLESFVAYDRRW